MQFQTSTVTGTLGSLIFFFNYTRHTKRFSQRRDKTTSKMSYSGNVNILKKYIMNIVHILKLYSRKN